ncbi:MAG: hypothetical protein RBG13Loki_4423 [Promethearchaeota archaeon CR_4]|nr:MAG: hypothetical protein RBG13Loki_4423 [Candidatus Lokiarchaeota archaeon CR_4]
MRMKVIVERKLGELIQRTKDIKSKVIAAIHLSNHYMGAYRTNPIQRIKFLVSCIDQIDRLLFTLEQTNHTVKTEYREEAINLLGEVVEAHNNLANEAVKESLEPIPRYIQKYMDAAKSKLEECKMEIFESPISKLIIVS